MDPFSGIRNDDLRADIETAINRHSAENGSDTPDHVLATYLSRCLEAFDDAVNAREAHYGRITDERTVDF